MKYLDLTLPTPAENLACDEALLDFCEENQAPEVLRVWEPTEYFVVVGYANKVATEVKAGNCRATGVAIFRRCSGGGAIVQGPGCLNYSVILNFADNSALKTITQTNLFVMGQHRKLFQTLVGDTVKIEGHTDLAIGSLKFSGNAQRRKKNFLLFHGTFLLDFDFSQVEKFLRLPSSQPSYRQNRSHENFLVNLHLSADEIKTRLREVWNAAKRIRVEDQNESRSDARTGLNDKNFPGIPNALREKYDSQEWTLKF